MLRGGAVPLSVVLAVDAILFAAGPARPVENDRGRELVEDVCTYCHGLSKLKGQQLSRTEWRDLIKGMISEGAPVTDEEFSRILDYLAAKYGKKDLEPR